MKLAIITVGFYEHDYDEKMRMILGSAARFNIPIQVYCETGKAWNFYENKIVKFGVFINNLRNDYTHILFTDAADSFFLADIDEIRAKYKMLGSPKLLVSGEKGCHPFGERENEFPESSSPFRFLNLGGFIGEIPHVLDCLSTCKGYSHLKTNDQGHWMMGYLEGKIKLDIDYNCQIFQTMTGVEPSEYRFGKERFKNIVTGSAPSIIHFNGGKDERVINLMNDVYNRYI